MDSRLLIIARKPNHPSDPTRPEGIIVRDAHGTFGGPFKLSTSSAGDPGFIRFAHRLNRGTAYTSACEPLAKAIPPNSGAVVKLTHEPRAGAIVLERGYNCPKEWNRLGSVGGKAPGRFVYVTIERTEPAPSGITLNY